MAIVMMFRLDLIWAVGVQELAEVSHAHSGHVRVHVVEQHRAHHDRQSVGRDHRGGEVDRQLDEVGERRAPRSRLGTAAGAQVGRRLPRSPALPRAVFTAYIFRTPRGRAEPAGVRGRA